MPKQKFINEIFPTYDMRDINDIMPKIPNMKWGALTNKFPTKNNVNELDKMLPHDKKWHTVFDLEDQVYVDDVRVWKKDKKAWT
ncbi:MAG TPA: hypothetical protein VIG05_04080 [Candidatus Nitrosotenuis sp.]|jgi:hypothetical protein